MKILRYIAFPFSFLYGLILAIRNLLFKLRILPITRINATVISIGNLSVGGTGKTPHVLELATLFSETKKTAILLRGYGRKTKGFYPVKENSTVNDVGDEALNYYSYLKKTCVIAVCEKRVDGAKQLLQSYPDLELILLDDAFQHQYIHRDFNLLLTEYNRPFFNDYVVPTGRLREFQTGKNRADCVIVTKSPQELSEEDKLHFINCLSLKNKPPVFFSSIKYESLVSISTFNLPQQVLQIVLVTGIGNPIPLLQYLQNSFMVEHIAFSDHHLFTPKDIARIHKLFDTFVEEEKIIVTTEKDAMRLLGSNVKSIVTQYPWFYQPIRIAIHEKENLVNTINGSFRTN